jgi:CTP synthase
MDMTKNHGEKQSKQKYIFVTGGVLSGVGKGITAASLGAVLQAKGTYVSIQKCDPYLNVDAGLLNPAEHGECFVTKDGAETDLDLGHYERFLDIELTQKNASLAGRIMSELIASERAGKLSGKTVQVIPHFTNAIQEKIAQAAEGSDVHIVEIGGTVGDYEGLAFIEAIREFGQKVGRTKCPARPPQLRYFPRCRGGTHRNASAKKCGPKNQSVIGRQRRLYCRYAERRYGVPHS